MLRAGTGHCAGAAMVEFHVVALFALLPLCLGTLQLALLMAENHHIDHATFQAARQAAMSGGDTDAARRALAGAAAALFLSGAGELDSGNATGRVARAYAAALADHLRFGRIRILNPTPEAQLDFAGMRAGRRVIPNDNLLYRPHAPGQRSGLTLQQANVLRLEVDWCRPLVVPFVRELLPGLLRRMDLDPWRQYCYSQGRVPIRSAASTPMQSDFRVSS
ncbi:MAG: pilus assembly protein [Pseudomonadota bacterium]|jgi:hypothetical protein